MPRLLSFAPDGGGQYSGATTATDVMLPPATEYTITGKRREAYAVVARSEGAFDLFGDRSPYDLQRIEFPFRLMCPTQTQADAIRTAFNIRGTIKAYQFDGTLRQTAFKAVDVQDKRSWRNKNFVDFVVSGALYPYWRSVGFRTFSGTSGTLTTRGNAYPYDSVTIVFTASGGGASAFTLTNGTSGYSVGWTGSLTAAQTVTINVPANTAIKTGSVDQLSSIVYGASQVGLFKLASGANTITSSITGAGSFLITWRDTWH